MLIGGVPSYTSCQLKVRGIWSVLNHSVVIIVSPFEFSYVNRFILAPQMNNQMTLYDELSF